MWDLVKTRHGKKHFVKAIKVSKDYGWRTALASLTLKVGFGESSKKKITKRTTGARGCYFLTISQVT